MSGDLNQTRRWLINTTSAMILSNALGARSSYAQMTNAPATKIQDPDEPVGNVSISPVTQALCDYVATTLERDMPPEVVARTKLHILDTIAAMVSGSRLKAGEMAARYVDSLGGKPQATVIGTGILTSAVNAALANGMAAHGDETDDSHLRGRFHPGCGIVPAALATAELADRNGNDLLRAVALGYDIGARLTLALGFGKIYSATVHTAYQRTLAPRQQLPRCYVSMHAGSGMHSRMRPNRLPVCPTGSATVSM